MDLVVGDKLSLKHPAVNMETDEQLFDKGTIVEVESIVGSKVGIRFPNFDHIIWHTVAEVAFLFNRESRGKVLTSTMKGLGTPPKALFKYMPEGADWQKNYVWSLTITLEERDDKDAICPDCTTELGNIEEKNEQGLVLCPQCSIHVAPVQLNVKK